MRRLWNGKYGAAVFWGEEKPAVQKIVLKGDEGPDAACCLAPDGSALYYPMTTGSLGTQVLKIDVRSGEVRSLCETETMVRWLSWIPEREQYLLLGFDRAREQNYFLWFKNDRIDMHSRGFCRKTRAVRYTSSMAAAACTRSAEQKRPWANTT